MNIQIYFAPVDRELFKAEGKPDGDYFAATEVVRSHILSEVRGYRNKLLSASDWVNNPDAPLSEADKAAWLTYRQALRDFPATLDFSVPFTLNDFSFPQPDPPQA